MSSRCALSWRNPKDHPAKNHREPWLPYHTLEWTRSFKQTGNPRRGRQIRDHHGRGIGQSDPGSRRVCAHAGFSFRLSIRRRCQPDALEQALGKLEQQGVQELPNLFADDLSDRDRRIEYQYLEDVAIGSIDLLIARLTPDARRLLWVVTLANEPNTETMIKGVWSGGSLEDEKIEQIRQLLQIKDQLPQEVRKQLDGLPAEIRARLEQPQSHFATPPLPPLLLQLHHSGLLSKESSTPEETSSVYAFHELTKERIAAWMANHEAERNGSSEKKIWLAYGERYIDTFKQLLQSAGTAHGTRQPKPGGAPWPISFKPGSSSTWAHSPAG